MQTASSQLPGRRQVTSPPLTVAHVVLSLECGGLEKVVLDLVRQGVRLGQKPVVICVEERGLLAEQVEGLGARVACAEKGRGLDLRARRRIERLLREHQPEVVHTHQIAALFYAGKAARRAGVPLVVHTEHGNHLRPSSAGFWRMWRRRWLWRLAGRTARRFFCVSDEIATELERQRVVSTDKLCVLPNGVDTAKFAQKVDRAAVRSALGIPPGARVIGTVGRLSEVKCQDLLLRAFVAVRARCPSTHLLLVGDGPMRESLAQMAAQLGVAHEVHFAGYQQEPAPFYQAMDVFALTSRSEGMPLALLEAWASGLPVVASAVGAIPKMIAPDRTGMLFRSGDEEALVGRLLEVLGKDELARHIAEEGRAHAVAEFGLERMAADYERHYRALLGSSKEAAS